MTGKKSGRFRRIASELNPLVWPLGALVVLYDSVQLRWRQPPTPYSWAEIGVPTEQSLAFVMRWIAAAQDASPDGGISAYYSLYGGFGPSYPETTGYLIPTLIDYGTVSQDPQWTERAVRATDWLMHLQFDQGAFPAGFAKSTDGPSVFNTGQIIFGLLGTYRLTGNSAYLQAATRAGHWLVSAQSPDGCWRQHTYEGVPHVYYTMVAWAQAELFQATGDDCFQQSAARNLEWALSHQQPNGWFEGYNLGGRPIYLHFIAYTLQGVLEAGIRIGSDAALQAMQQTAEKLLRMFEIKKRLMGAYSSAGKATIGSACLTGDAQISIVWLRLAELTGDLRFLNASLKMNELIKSGIWYRGPTGLLGGVKGSDPVWGRYLWLRYPCWAAKFTADSFMLELSSLAKCAARLSPCGS